MDNLIVERFLFVLPKDTGESRTHDHSTTSLTLYQLLGKNDTHVKDMHL